jgi:hypothetical protein
LIILFKLGEEYPTIFGESLPYRILKNLWNALWNIYWTLLVGLQVIYTLIWWTWLKRKTMRQYFEVSQTSFNRLCEMGYGIYGRFHLLLYEHREFLQINMATWPDNFWWKPSILNFKIFCLKAFTLIVCRSQLDSQTWPPRIAFCFH